MEVVVAFMTGNDVFAVLPTGFGKSLCYACLPLAFAELEKAERTEGPTVVVATPLTAIIDHIVFFLLKLYGLCCHNGVCTRVCYYLTSTDVDMT